jgi:Uma2 family endonuclease
MSVMNIAEAWPAAGRSFTVDDLDRMPEDGRRYELVDGVLVVSPRPRISHQEVAMELAVLLRTACPAHLRVIHEPAVQVSHSTEFDPDVVVIPQEQLGAVKLTEPPLLVAEVRSPSTALIDLSTKKAAYQRFGVQSYWIVVPDAERPELRVLELGRDGYQEMATVTGTAAFRAVRPFPVEVTAARLVAGLFQR